jgi:hypothetical protein
MLSCSSEDLRTAVIRPLHLTFAEFLMDSKRCTNAALHTDHRVCHLNFAKACLSTLNNSLRLTMFERERTTSCEYVSKPDRRSLFQEVVPAHVLSACNYWTEHLVEIERSSDPALLRVLDEFCKKKLLQWVTLLASARNCGLEKMLRVAYSWVKVSDILQFRFTLQKHNCVLSGTRRWRGYFEHSIRCMAVSG